MPNDIQRNIKDFFKSMSSGQYIDPSHKPVSRDENKIYFNRVNTNKYIVDIAYGYNVAYNVLYTYYKFKFLYFLLINENEPDILDTFFYSVLNLTIKDEEKNLLISCLDGTDVRALSLIEYLNSQKKVSLGLSYEFWKDILIAWKKISNIEVKVYKLRVNQHGRKKTNEFWYNDLLPFNSWAEEVEKINVEHEYPEMFPSLSMDDSQKAKESANAVISKIIEKFSFYKSEYVSEKLIISGFLQVLLEHYCFDICDYLDLEDKSIKLVDYEINYRTKSVSNRYGEDVLLVLRQSETYKPEEGISGSVLIGCSEEIATLFHVGTNNLSLDYRQSPWHNSNYLNVYGKDILNDDNYSFENFWVFPLRDENDKIFSVFRVINKRKNGVFAPLSIKERYELIHIARWFAEIIRYTNAVFKGKIIGLNEQNDWYYFDVDSQKEMENLCCEIESLKYMSRNTFKLLMDHLIITANRKVENRSVGCTIYYINDNKIWNPCKLERLDAGSVHPVDASFDWVAQKYYAKYSPNNTVFVYANSNNDSSTYLFCGILRLCYTQGEYVLRSFSAIKAITSKNNKILCFSLDGKNKTIKLFYKGTEQVQCYLSQSCGKWKMRNIEERKNNIYDSIEKNLNKNGKLSENVLENYKTIVDILFPILLHCSNINQGTTIVFDCENKFMQSQKSICFVGNTISIEMEYFKDFDFQKTYTEELFAYLSLDGATIIDNDLVARKSGVILRSIDSNGCSQGVKNILEKYSKGSRHTSAAFLAHSHQETLVFVVSENGGISIFMGDEILLFDW